MHSDKDLMSPLVYYSDAIQKRAMLQLKYRKYKDVMDEQIFDNLLIFNNFVCVEVLRPSQLSGVMSSAVSLPSHTFTGQA